MPPPPGSRSGELPRSRQAPHYFRWCRAMRIVVFAPSRAWWLCPHQPLTDAGLAAQCVRHTILDPESMSPCTDALHMIDYDVNTCLGRVETRHGLIAVRQRRAGFVEPRTADRVGPITSRLVHEGREAIWALG